MVQGEQESKMKQFPDIPPDDSPLGIINFFTSVEIASSLYSGETIEVGIYKERYIVTKVYADPYLGKVAAQRLTGVAMGTRDILKDRRVK